MILKFIGKCKGLWIDKEVFRTVNLKTESLITIYQDSLWTKLIREVWHYRKPENGTEQVYKQSNICPVTWFMTKATLQWSAESMVFSVSSDGSIAYPYKKKKFLDPYFSPYTKINSILIAHLNARGKTNKALMWKQREYL